MSSSTKDNNTYKKTSFLAGNNSSFIKKFYSDYLSDPEKALKAHSGNGPPLEIRILNKRYKATILDDVPFDPQNTRLKS